MGNNKTVFVVGAGASSEFGLPVGSELKIKISSLLNIQYDNWGMKVESGSAEIAHALKREADTQLSIQSYIDSASKISKAMPLAISIDNFLDAHNDDVQIELCGKLAIVQAILDAERRSKIYVPQDNIKKAELSIAKVADSWITSFFRVLIGNCKFEDLETRLSEVVLIVFNYDRCIEHFLLHALITYYKVDTNQAASLLEKLVIYHPYGTVGDLEWRNGKNKIPFGSPAGSTTLVKLASGIRTFTEGTDSSSSNIIEIRRHYKQAQRVVFLGFAYHAINLRLLAERSGLIGNPDRQDQRRYFGSALGISPSDCNVIKNDLSSSGLIVEENILLRNDLTCAELMREYSKSLSW